MKKHIISVHITLLLALNIFIGLFIFRDYGLSWDEPLFYDYAKALQYAYSPKEWFSGNFNLENAYGASGTDHANRGSAYLVLAQPLVNLIQSLGIDLASAWHLINFLTFQLGVYLLYRFARRWVDEIPATVAAAFFTWQPLLWGHAFINPKDPPFLVFFLGAVCFGFEMVDAIHTDMKDKNLKIFLAAFFLGTATSIRVLGPLAGLLTVLYAATFLPQRKISVWIKPVSIYVTLTILIAFVTWPYLWQNPLGHFLQAFGFMSDNPTQLQVLFNGEIYRADALPRRYLPTLLALTLTEPVWILFFAGLIFAFMKHKEKPFHVSLVLLWFLIPLFYVLVLRPPMYDGFRHFLFMLPPVFIFAAFAFEKIIEISKSLKWMNTIFLFVFISTIANISLHPYQYTYYNAFVGGTSGAFRKYETEYWLTCYKQVMQEFIFDGHELYVKREPYIAAYYIKDPAFIHDYREDFGKIASGDYVLVNTRTNEDIKTFKNAPVVYQIFRGNAVFCEVKQIP